MAQSDYTIPNVSAPAVRADLNDTFLAIATNNSGATAPATTFAYQWWYDTTANILKMRNAANSAWINVAAFNQGAGNFLILSRTLPTNDWETGTSTTETVVSPAKIAAAIAALADVSTEIAGLAGGGNGYPYILAAWHPYDSAIIGDGNTGAVWDFAVDGNVTSVAFNTEPGYDYRVFGDSVTGALNVTVDGFQDENSSFASYAGLSLTGLPEQYFEVEIPSPYVVRDRHLAVFRATPGGTYATGAGIITNGNGTRITQIRLNLGLTQTGGKIFVYRRLNYRS